MQRPGQAEPGALALHMKQSHCLQRGQGKDGRKDNLEDEYDEENEERGNIFEEEKAFRGRTTLVMRRRRRRMGGEVQPQE